MSKRAGGSRGSKRKGPPAAPLDLPDPEPGPSQPPAKLLCLANMPDPMSGCTSPPHPKPPSPFSDSIYRAPRPTCPPSPALSHAGSVAGSVAESTVGSVAGSVAGSAISLADPEHFAAALAILQSDTFKRPEPKKIQLNAKGELTDAHGNKIELEPVSTLKANLKRPKGQQQQKTKIPKPPSINSNPYFDASLAPGGRKARPLRFLEAGSVVRRAEKLRRVQRSQALYTKRQEAGKAFAGKEVETNPNLVPVVKKPAEDTEDVPDPPAMEWWDEALLRPEVTDRKYVDIASDLSNINTRLVNMLIEHPPVVVGPNLPPPPTPLPLMLTKTERKKIRTQGRIAREKEKQEQIKLGLMEPPKPKVKVNNLMRVLGTEATQDPTAMERFVRAEMEARRSAHDARNQERKLTPDERRRKQISKAQKAARNDPIVSVFKVADLSSKQKKFKVSTNATQLMLTGCAILTPGLQFIVVEGGVKPMRKYIHLLQDRIKWDEDSILDASGTPAKDDDGNPQPNWCALVWQGLVSQPLFVGFKLQRFDSEAKARSFLQDKGVVHYFDMADKFVPGVTNVDPLSDGD